MEVLPAICKDSKKYIPAVAFTLAPMLPLDKCLHNTPTNILNQIYREDPLETIKTMFDHSYKTNVEAEVEKCLLFLYKEIVKMEDKLSNEINDLLLEEGKKSYVNSGAFEFGLVMPYLVASKLTKTIAGQQELVNLVAEIAEIDGTFDPLEKDGDNVKRVLMYVDSILPLFNANIESTSFTKFYCDQMLPNYEAIGKLKNGSTLEGHCLKQLAELSTHCGKLEYPYVHVYHIFHKLKHFMPLPLEEMPNLNFGAVECLLYAFHRLARQCPDFLTKDPYVLNDFRSRLAYFSRGLAECKRSFEKHSGKNMTEEQVRIAPTFTI
nr:unnamed protein product [Callosobruchus chinensis]